VDPFQLSPHTYFSPGFGGGLANYATDWRPELIGSLLLAGGLYFGFGPTRRWGASAEAALAAALGRGGRLPPAAAADVATALHGAPFVLAGFAADAALKAAGGSVLAVSLGLTTFLWAGVFEARRSSEYSRAVGDAEDEEAYAAFADWASRRLTTSGRCHISGLAKAFRAECPTVRVRRPGAEGGGMVGRRVSDGQLRRFVQRWAPKAVRSPNGFYRRLSLVEKRKP